MRLHPVFSMLNNHAKGSNTARLVVLLHKRIKKKE